MKSVVLGVALLGGSGISGRWGLSVSGVVLSSSLYPSATAAGRAFQQGVHTGTESLTLPAHEITYPLHQISPSGLRKNRSEGKEHKSQ